MNLNKYKGIWLYGLSGVGKTHASKFIKKKINRSIIIDGDDVRKKISFDLDYSIKDRKIQIERVYGLSKIIINSGCFPVISTVYMNQKIINKTIKSKILLVLIKREMSKIFKKHKTYKNKNNVIGVDLHYQNKLKSKVIFNDGGSKFCQNILKLIK